MQSLISKGCCGLQRNFTVAGCRAGGNGVWALECLSPLPTGGCVCAVAQALAANRIDPRRAGLLLYALQVASTNVRNVHLSRSAVRSVTYTADGAPLAPQNYGYDAEDDEEEDQEEGARTNSRCHPNRESRPYSQPSRWRARH